MDDNYFCRSTTTTFAGRRDAESRYRQFLEHVTRRFSGGRRFLDDLPRESIADEVGLAAMATNKDRPAGATLPGACGDCGEGLIATKS
jgi:hypothetical protein